MQRLICDGGRCRSSPLNGASPWQKNGLHDSGTFQVIDFGGVVTPRMEVNIEHGIPPRRISRFSD